ncbi:erythromycin esterase family protein [Nonomuraea aridisoli]|uniref:Erythromycin esterase n=1 Tax=Nonomuraea aridisoli TaxID=2070368 RepID=A0A2W2E0P0_9ACTN|nr:erythromycin esterase family protein [Nonomuraea aridisoli]PZG05678.1 erythromycin esterase [Nonomuraea aridisoli]
MPDDVTAWLAGRAIPLGRLEPLKDVLDGVSVIGLGESTHGGAEFFPLRWRLTEFLVEELGFTTLAIEASAAAARAVDAYVTGGTGDPRAALAGLGFWTLNTAEMLTVIERLREHNSTAARPVRFAGVDPQHPEAALRALRARLGPDAAELLDPLDGLAGTTPRPRWEPLDRQVEADARRLEEHVAAHGPAEAREHARIVRQFADMVSRPFRHADPLRTLGVARDRHMAENVNLLMAEPDTKIVLWAHNGHVMKGRYGGGTVPSMGLHLARDHGAAYYALGATFGKGVFRAHHTRFGRIVRRRSPARFRVPLAGAPHVVEARLAAAHPGDHVIDLRDGDRSEPVADWLAATNHMRAFGGVANRLTAKFAFMPTVLADQYDGLAFLHRITASTPLDG